MEQEPKRNASAFQSPGLSAHIQILSLGCQEYSSQRPFPKHIISEPSRNKQIFSYQKTQNFMIIWIYHIKLCTWDAFNYSGKLQLRVKSIK